MSTLVTDQPRFLKTLPMLPVPENNSNKCGMPTFYFLSFFYRYPNRRTSTSTCVELGHREFICFTTSQTEPARTTPSTSSESELSHGGRAYSLPNQPPIVTLLMTASHSVALCSIIYVDFQIVRSGNPPLLGYGFIRFRFFVETAEAFTHLLQASELGVRGWRFQTWVVRRSECCPGASGVCTNWWYACDDSSGVGRYVLCLVDLPG